MGLLRFLSTQSLYTHSDTTTELFLTIGLTYADDKTNAMRDEVLGEWISREKGCVYHVYLYVDRRFFRVHPMYSLLDN